MDLESISEWWTAIWANPDNIYIAIGVCLFLLVLLVAFVFRPRKAKSVLAYEDENGRVEVSCSAINELVQSACQQIETVAQPKVKTWVKKGAPMLQIRLKVQGDARMKEIRERLRNHLRLQLMENLGFEQLGSIDILVTSVADLPSMPAATAASPAAVTSNGAEYSATEDATYDEDLDVSEFRDEDLDAPKEEPK